MTTTTMTATATASTTSTTAGRPRVWLVAGLSTTDSTCDTAPVDLPVVRDDLMRTWAPGPDSRYHTANGRHHATWRELHARFDLVEVPR